MLLVHLLSQMAVLIIGKRPTGLLNAVLGRSSSLSRIWWKPDASSREVKHWAHVPQSNCLSHKMQVSHAQTTFSIRHYDSKGTQYAAASFSCLVSKTANLKFEIHINFTQYWSFVQWGLVSLIPSGVYIKGQHIPACRCLRWQTWHEQLPWPVKLSSDQPAFCQVV